MPGFIQDFWFGGENIDIVRGGGWGFSPSAFHV